MQPAAFALLDTPNETERASAPATRSLTSRAVVLLEECDDVCVYPGRIDLRYQLVRYDRSEVKQRADHLHGEALLQSRFDRVRGGKAS
jgi:hypothetical protein